MRPLAATGSWPSIAVEEGRWLRLSILPKEAGSDVSNKASVQLKQWKAYLLAGLEEFAGGQAYSEKSSYHKKGRHIIETNV